MEVGKRGSDGNRDVRRKKLYMKVVEFKLKETVIGKWVPVEFEREIVYFFKERLDGDLKGLFD